jgi:rhodanese-related sulfurtransferase
MTKKSSYNFSKRLVVVLLFIVITAACGSKPDEPASTIPGEAIGQVVPVENIGYYTDILPSELQSMMDSKDFLFINVHVPFEGDIPLTDASIPFDEIESHISELPEDKNAKIVVYCRSGSMSAIAAKKLIEQGYTNIYNLDGGFRAWFETGYELLD